MKKNKNSKSGFTLVELLAVIVIIGIITIIAIMSVSNYLARGKKEYYKALENNVLTSAQDYLLDYKSLFPKNINSSIVVSGTDLISNNYIDSIKDENDANCEASVTVTKTAKSKYDYDVCLKCGSLYTSSTTTCSPSSGGSTETGDRSTYSITLNASLPTSIKQCENVDIPTATVKESGTVITSSLQGAPKSLDTTILGTNTIKWTYRYQSTSKTISVVDGVKPTTPTVTLAYESGAPYSGEITNKNVVITVKSIDYACPDKYTNLKGSGIAKVMYKQASSSTWKTVITTKETTAITITDDLVGTIELKTVDAKGNESDTTTFTSYIDRAEPSVPTVTYLGGSNTHSFKNNYKLQVVSTDNAVVSYYEIDTNSDGIAEMTTTGTFIPENNFSSCNVRFRAVDAAGNKSDWTTTNHVHMDTEKPSKPTITVATKKATIVLKDNIGITSWQVTTASTTPTSGWTNITSITSTTVTYPFTAVGTYYAWAKDEAGNINSQTFVVEENNLCMYDAGQVWNFAYTGNIQTFNTPCDGRYKLQVWGGQGSGPNDYGYMLGSGGGGGSATGDINLTSDTNLYIGVGGKGLAPTGGYNGGGGGGVPGDGFYTGGGGGATHIAINNNRGVLSTYTNNRDEVLIVAGGGGGATARTHEHACGGSGGGTNGSLGCRTYDDGQTGSQAGQTSGCGFGQGCGGAYRTGGGGGGWYGGNISVGNWVGGSGGSGYLNTSSLISGTTGMSNGVRGGDGYATITLISVAE